MAYLSPDATAAESAVRSVTVPPLVAKSEMYPYSPCGAAPRPPASYSIQAVPPFQKSFSSKRSTVSKIVVVEPPVAIPSDTTPKARASWYVQSNKVLPIHYLPLCGALSAFLVRYKFQLVIQHCVHISHVAND